MRVSAPVLALVVATSALQAQAGRPAPLTIRTDASAPDSAVQHQLMPPGWHMTTGPAAILYDPAHQARGRYAVEAEIFLFPGESNEGYGVFLGGTELNAAGAKWTAFLITRDGSATIQKREGVAMSVVYPLTKSPAVKAHTGEGTSHNVIRVLVQGDSVIFSSNGQRITALQNTGVSLDGSFGFRVGTALNLHASNLDHISRLAPFPVRR